MRKHILFTQKMKKYAGKYVAVAGGSVVASGRNAGTVFRSAKKNLRNQRKIEGVYYVPQQKDLLTALCGFRTSR